MHLQAGLVLRVVIQFIRHGGEIVTDTATHGYRDLFASAFPVVASEAGVSATSIYTGMATTDTTADATDPVTVSDTTNPVTVRTGTVRYHANHR